MALSLVKEKAEAVGISLKKKGVTSVPPMRVVALFDVSGSMSSTISRGDLQKAADQVLGVAYKFDDNGEVDVFTFDSAVRQPASMGIDDFGTYVQQEIVRKGFNTGGGTDYSTALAAVDKFLFAEKGGSKGMFGFGAKKGAADNSLALVLFFTDGDDGGSGADGVLKSMMKKNVYVHLIGVGRSNFSGLSRLADRFDNVGMVALSSFNLPDSEIYDQLVSDEFVAFLKSHATVPA